MAKSFLRSGMLDAVLALGENGQPVYASALQLRETLRLRKQQKIADCLAIPQPNESGERIDWYAPFSGKVKSWHAASDSERASAINLLESCQHSVADISLRAQSAEKPAMQLFGALLSKAFQFPDQHYIYLVDGKPVITFWGFVELDKKSRSDALDCLRGSLQLTPPPAAPVYIAPPVAIPLPEVEMTPAAPPVGEPVMAAPQPEVKTPRSHWRRLWWLLPPVLAAGAFALLQQHSAAPEIVAPAAEPATPAPVAVKPIAKITLALPLQPAAVTPDNAKAVVVSEEKPAEIAPETPALLPAGKDMLMMPADAVKVGSTRFLNGSWRVTLEAGNLPTGKPPSLKYQIHNGKGSARVLQGDGISCKADISAGLMSSGNLVINSRYTARCSDGSRYRMPEITCKATSEAADCSARYGDDTVFPMTMKREKN